MTQGEKWGLITLLIGLTGILGSLIKDNHPVTLATDLIVFLLCVMIGSLFFVFGDKEP